MYCNRMRTVHLFHDSRLGVSSGQSGPVPLEWSPPQPDATVLSFRPFHGRPHGDFIPAITATTRLLRDFGPHVCTYALEADSALAPLLLWDIAHALPEGGTVTVAADAQPAYLARAYYRDGLTAEASGPNWTTFRKTAPLPAERDRGLTRWTFGIPTGPGDATGLNAVVKRILELGVPEFEILLCGRPGKNFRYFDRVTVVGEDIVGTPVPIAAKKNRLAESAKYENLCVIHDRVFLPRDFYAAVTQFGDLFPFTCFQSLWFDDPYNLIGKRYSDYARLLNPAPVLSGLGPAGSDRAFRPGLITEVERGGFISANPLRYNQGNYCTGSLYMAKRAVWLACPQDGRLGWQQCEDVEHGLRGNAMGVPHRVNPFAFTQSLFARPQMPCRELLYETNTGALTKSVNVFEEVRMRRKPLARVSVAGAHEKLHAFLAKWVPRHYQDVFAAEISRPAADADAWGRQVAVAVYGAAVDFGEENVLEFLRDYESHLVYDTFSMWTRRYLLEHFACFGSLAKDALVERGGVLGNMILYRARGNLFYESMAEYFPERTRSLDWGTWLSARRMARHDGTIIHHPGGRPGFLAGIENSTPYREYFEG
jgi:hypothetical protein